MRSIILLSSLVAIALSTSAEEITKPWKRFVYFPDSKGNIHQVDLQAEDIAPITRVEPDSVKFYLFTRSNPTDRQQLYLNDVHGLENSNFDASKPTKFLAHGWMDDVTSDFNTLLVRSTLEHFDANVIVFDWGTHAGSVNYMYSARTVGAVGEVLGKFVDFTIEAGSDPYWIHLVGFSLGAHVIANAARNLEHGKLHYITGLDPAGPLFGPENGQRIAPTDADIVEIIHTNGDNLGNGDLLGTADYFPNGGRWQAGCWLPTCSHPRAYEYFAESIGNKHGFMGVRCDNKDDAIRENCYGEANYPMGGSWFPKYWYGIFHMVTNRRSPFAKN